MGTWRSVNKDPRKHVYRLAVKWKICVTDFWFADVKGCLKLAKKIFSSLFSAFGEEILHIKSKDEEIGCY